MHMQLFEPSASQPTSCLKGGYRAHGPTRSPKACLKRVVWWAQVEIKFSEKKLTVFSHIGISRYCRTSPVAEACATIAPVATPKGFWAAPKAIVVRKDRSPNSAAKTKENVCRIRALSASSTNSGGRKGMLTARREKNEWKNWVSFPRKTTTTFPLPEPASTVVQKVSFSFPHQAVFLPSSSLTLSSASALSSSMPSLESSGSW